MFVTPARVSQAGLRPSMSFDFRRQLDAIRGGASLTFTRASAGYYTNKDGTLTSFASGEARLGDRGLLIEEARTNLLLRSQEFDGAAWDTFFGATATANATTAPDGTTTAARIVEATGSSSSRLFQGLNKAASAIQYTYSVYLKADTRDYAFIAIDNAALDFANIGVNLAAGTVRVAAGGSGFTGISGSIEGFANGWHRVVLTATSDATTNLRAYVSPDDGTKTAYSDNYTGDGSGIFSWGGQLEAGAFPTSYIATTSASVTRAADVASVTGIDSASWFNSSEGTIVARAEVLANAPTSGIVWQLEDGSSTRIIAFKNGASATNFSAYGEGGFFITGTMGIIGTPKTSALAYAANDVAFCGDGDLLGSDSSYTVDAVDRLLLGRSNVGGVAYLNGYLPSLSYYPRRLPNDRLKALSS